MAGFFKTIGSRAWLSASSRNQALYSKATVYFGSQTGTARMFARELAENLRSDFGCESDLIDLTNFSPSQLAKDRLSLFVCSSFGKGEPTDNARTFDAWLRTTAEKLEGVPFAVFGCGMSCTYPDNYQAFPKHVEASLRRAGALPVVRRGVGDDSKDIEEDFHLWYDTVFKPIFRLDPGSPLPDYDPSSTAPCASLLSSCSISFTGPSSDSPSETPSSSPTSLFLASPSSRYGWESPFFATVERRRTLTAPEHCMRKAIHFDFDLRAAPALTMAYETGDYLAILPSNLRAVDSVIKLLRWSGQEELQAPSFPGIPRLPPSFTVREALTHYFDIRNPPKRALIRTLAEFAECPFEQRTLTHLGATADENQPSSFYQQYILRDNRGIATILRDFPSIRINPTTLIARLGPIKPRLYSIANSAVGSAASASICMSILYGPAPDGRPWYGTNSYFMDQSLVGDRVPLFIQKSSIRLPPNPSSPLIMVGVGTGISLFRSFWQERCRSEVSSGPNLLFYGCNGLTDELYREEIESVPNLTVFRSHTFDPAEPTFVQYRFAQQGPELVDLILNQGAFLYVCGHKALGCAIQDTLLTSLRKHGSMHYHEAVAYLNHLKATSRFVEEIFQ